MVYFVLHCYFYKHQSIESWNTIDGACHLMASLGIVLRNPTPYDFMFKLEELPTVASCRYLLVLHITFNEC